ncbi:MAG: hypothetical protein IKA00_06400 [Prevotella sp.]|nr:hypothetical protein [Prevotella sp.]
MKRIYLFVLTALMILMSTSAMAQSETIKGDVNGDGVVDVADIAAVIKIMTNNGDIQKKYYWYVGQENPANMTSISPIVDDNTSPGWRLIGTTIPTYTFDNPLYNASVNPIVSNPSKNDYWYIALPENSSLSVYDSDDVNQLTNGNWTKESTQFSNNNTKYNIYKIAAPQRKFTGLWVH